MEKRAIKLIGSLWILATVMACGSMKSQKGSIVNLVHSASTAASGNSDNSNASNATAAISADTTSNVPKVFYGIYMVGSTLENDTTAPTQYGAGESDLREIVAGYAALTDDQKQNVKIVVAFGGADKQGWEGMKVADISCLIHDSLDEYFGDDSCYLLDDATLDMSQATTLTAFLQIYKTQSAGYQTKVFDLWGHGDGSGGAGFADVSKGDEHISVQDLAGSFVTAGVTVDVFSFDACLMASIEILNSLQNVTRYLVASEQEVPGIGFDYTDIIKSFANSVAPLDIAKAYVDTFIDGQSSSYDSTTTAQITEVPQSSSGGGKTLSVFDLKQTSAVISAATKFISYLGPVNNTASMGKVITAANAAHQYSGVTFDLIDFLQHFSSLNASNSSAVAAATQFINAIQNGVVYIRQDGSEPFSHGLSMVGINSPDNWKGIYPGTMTYVSPTWDLYIRQFAAEGAADTVAPTISAASSCKSDDGSMSGHCLTATDNIFVDLSQTVANVCVAANASSPCLDFSAAQTTVNAKGQIFVADTDINTSLFLCDGPCATATHKIPVPVLADATSGKMGTAAQVNGIDVFLAIDIDWTQAQPAIKSIQIITTATDGTTSQSQLLKGDSVEISYNTVDSHGNITTAFGAPMTLTNAPNFAILPLISPMIIRTAVQVFDLSSNSSSTVYGN